MEKMQLLDETQYFVESKKVIQIVLEKEETLTKQLSTKDKLQVVKEQKEKTTSPEEYDELEKLEKELEKKVRFNQYTVPAVPEEHREMIMKNIAVEQLEVDEKLNELKKELKGQIEHLESNLLPLLENIRRLEQQKGIPHQIKALIDSEVGEGISYPISYVLNRLTPSNDETQSAKAKAELEKVVKALKKIEVPVETTGLLAFLKRGKK